MISVIIPIYNVLPYVEKCVRSVMEQGYRDLEIMLIDDGSTDGSGKICDTLAEEDARIRVLHTENRGLSAARNLGCRESKGEYIYYLDGDDMLTEDCLSVLSDALLESGADMCVGGFCMVNPDGDTIRKVLVKNNAVVTPEEYLERQVTGVSGYIVNAWNKLMKREVAEKVNFPEEINYEDRATFARFISVCGKIMMISRVTYFYNIKRPGSITSTYSIKNLEDYLKSSEIMEDDVKTGFIGASCAQNFSKIRELRDSQFAWSYIVMYLESIKNTGTSELKQQLVFLKKQYISKIKLSRDIQKIKRFKTRILLRMIQACPGLAENLYVFRAKRIN